MQTKNSKASTIIDCFFLFAVVAISFLPYVGRLGFYADDWDYLGILTRLSRSGFVDQFRALAQEEPAMIIRPVHPVYFIGCFKVFGMHPLSYHVLNLVAIALATVFLYLALQELLGERWLAFAIALTFGVAPHYSTDRFWFTGQVANLSMDFLFLGTYFILGSTGPHAKRRSVAFFVGIALLVLSILTYEVALGWIAALVGLVVYRAIVIARKARSAMGALPSILFLGLPLVLVGLWKISRQSRISQHHHFWTNLGLHTTNALEQALRFNFWNFGFKMPAALFALQKQSALTCTAIASSFVIGTLLAAYLWRYMDSAAIPNPTRSIQIVLLGLLIFCLGFVLFFTSSGQTLEFTTVGLDNRIAIASAPGAACVAVALAALVSSLVRSPVLRLRCFSVLVAFICAGSCLVVDGIASYWVDAAAKQHQILQSLAADVPTVPSRSVLLLDGFCRYSGPGFVFETDGDATGAIQILFKDASLRGDVVSPDLHFDVFAVNTTYYGVPEEKYSYGEHLFIYNAKYRAFKNLRSFENAREYSLAENPTGDSGCPVARDGNGEKIF